MSDPKVVHPTTQNRIDFRNHNLHGPADVLSEDLPELFKQRCPLLQLGRLGLTQKQLLTESRTSIINRCFGWPLRSKI
jgi:hypothetical protein